MPRMVSAPAAPGNETDTVRLSHQPCFFVQRAHSLSQVHAAQLIVLRHLANEQACIHGIFVAHMIADK